MEYMYNNVTPKEKQCCKQRKKRGVGFASIIFKKETGTICPLFVNTKFPKNVHKEEFYVTFLFMNWSFIFK